MKRYFVFLIAFFLLLSGFPGLAPSAAETVEPKLQVKLVNYIGNRTQLTLGIHGEFLVANQPIRLADEKSYTAKVEDGKISLFDGTVKVITADTLELLPAQPGSYLSVNNRPYLGSFRFVVENSTFIRPINTVYLEDYLKGVVPFEMMAGWNKEALKAQSVAARTYAAGYLSRVIDDTISYQVYGGYAWHANSTAAVEETSGQVLKMNGRYISTVFSASNGGKTESNSNIWGSTPLSYLPIKEDPYDPKTPWQFAVKKQQINPSVLDLKNPSLWWNQTKEADSSLTASIKNWLSKNGYAGKEIKIVAIPTLSLHAPTSGGRVSKGSIKVEFFVKDAIDQNGELILQTVEYTNTSASRIRAMIGNRVILSYLVTNLTETNENITVSGLGDGHGVGLSQWGAKNRADAGQSYADILGFYYDGASLVKEYTGREQNAAAIPATKDQTAPDSQKPVSGTPEPAESAADKIAPSINQVEVTVDHLKKKASISFKTNETAKVTVYIRNAQGKILTYLFKDTFKTAGTIENQYDISKLPNGTYSAGIVTIDGSNNRSSALSSFKVTNAAPAVKKSAPAPAVKKKTGVVTASKLTVRSSASTKGKVMGSLKKKQTVTILSTSGSWHKIQYGKKSGYVSKSYIK